MPLYEICCISCSFLNSSLFHVYVQCIPKHYSAPPVMLLVNAKSSSMSQLLTSAATKLAKRYASSLLSLLPPSVRPVTIIAYRTWCFRKRCNVLLLAVSLSFSASYFSHLLSSSVGTPARTAAGSGALILRAIDKCFRFGPSRAVFVFDFNVSQQL